MNMRVTSIKCKFVDVRTRTRGVREDDGLWMRFSVFVSSFLRLVGWLFDRSAPELKGCMQREWEDDKHQRNVASLAAEMYAAVPFVMGVGVWV